MNRLFRKLLISSGKMPDALRVRMNISGLWPLSRLLTTARNLPAAASLLQPKNLLAPRSLLPAKPANLLLLKSPQNRAIRELISCKKVPFLRNFFLVFTQGYNPPENVFSAFATQYFFIKIKNGKTLCGA